MIKHKYLVLSLIIAVLLSGFVFVGLAVTGSFESGNSQDTAGYYSEEQEDAEFVDDSEDEPNSKNMEDDRKSPKTRSNEESLGLLSKLGINTIEEKDLLIPKYYTPNDPYYPLWYLTNVSAPSAWDITTKTATTTVAVIDSGYALAHEDLVHTWTVNSGETGQTQSGEPCWDESTKDKDTNNCDDNNGYVDDHTG